MNRYCDLCHQGPITSESQWQQHINGKKHKKNQWKNGSGMQYDLPDDKRSAFFVPSAAAATIAIKLEADDDLEEMVKYEESSTFADAFCAKNNNASGYHSFEGMDFPALGASQPAAFAGPSAASDGFPALSASSSASVSGLTSPMAKLGIGRGRGRAKPTPPGNTGAPAKSWSSITQPTSPPRSEQVPPTHMGSPLSTQAAEPRKLTQSERSGNVRVIQAPSSEMSVGMPAAGNRPQAKAPKLAMAKRIYHEYKAKKKTASQAFQEIATNLVWTIEDEEVMPDSANFYSYAMRWIVNGFTCERGEGSKKKIAKENASRKALAKFANVIENPDKYTMEEEEERQSTAVAAEPSLPNPADDYKRLTMGKVDELIKMVKRNKIDLDQPLRFAAFIVTRLPSQPASEGTVVAIGTGRYTTKMSEKDGVEAFGYRLHDMQAPVIAKRAFQAYLYGQLSQVMQSDRGINRNKYGENILEYNSDGHYRLRDGVRIHLYLSHAPSGDAIAYINDKWTEPETLSHDELDRDLHGKLKPAQVDIEKGYGRLRLVTDSVRDTTALLDSKEARRLDGKVKIMSLSDKLMKWTHVGVQGALLTHFIEPIFLYSIQFGCNYAHDHSSRAVINRVPLSVFPALPDGYCNAPDPFIGRPTKMVRLRNQIEGAVTWNWFYGTDTVELVDANEGLLDPRYLSDEEFVECSRLSRVTMLQRLEARWSSVFDSGDVVSTALTRRLREALKVELKECEYGDLKKAAKEYQAAKSKIYSTLCEKLMGTWRSKVEMQRFTLLDYEYS